MQKKCKICIKNFEIIVDLKHTQTIAEKIWDALPIKSNINVWGDEIYFIPLFRQIKKRMLRR